MLMRSADTMQEDVGSELPEGPIRAPKMGTKHLSSIGSCMYKYAGYNPTFRPWLFVEPKPGCPDYRVVLMIYFIPGSRCIRGQRRESGVLEHLVQGTRKKFVTTPAKIHATLCNLQPSLLERSHRTLARRRTTLVASRDVATKTCHQQ